MTHEDTIRALNAQYEVGYKLGYMNATQRYKRIMENYIKEMQAAFDRWEDSDNER